MTLEKLDGFTGVARRGQYQGYRISVEVRPGIALFTVFGTRRRDRSEVAWEASATDYEGVLQWLEEFGLLEEAAAYNQL